MCSKTEGPSQQELRGKGGLMARASSWHSHLEPILYSTVYSSADPTGKAEWVILPTLKDQ